jgi:hypothetical protein
MSCHSAWNLCNFMAPWFFCLSLAVTNLKNRQIYQIFTKILYDVETFMLWLCMSLHLNLGLILRLIDETQSFLSYFIVTWLKANKKHIVWGSDWINLQQHGTSMFELLGWNNGGPAFFYQFFFFLLLFQRNFIPMVFVVRP